MLCTKEKMHNTYHCITISRTCNCFCRELAILCISDFEPSLGVQFKGLHKYTPAFAMNVVIHEGALTKACHMKIT